MKKNIKYIIILVILFFPLKWFLFNPIYDSYLSSKIEKITKEEFVQKSKTVNDCKSSGDINELHACEDKNKKITAADEGVVISTKKSQYYFVEKSSEPVWRSCIYKVTDSTKKLLPIPGNCRYWTWYHFIFSSESENLIIYQNGYEPIYIVDDNGEISSYFKNQAKSDLFDQILDLVFN